VLNLNSFFIGNEHTRSQMNLVLSLLASGCTFEQIKKIIKCKQNSLQSLVLHYYGKSKSLYLHLHNYLSDEQCLQIRWMILNEKADFNRKFLMKLIYPSFICFLTFMSLIFFKFNMLNRIQAMFKDASSDMIFTYFDWIIYFLVVIYLIFISLLVICSILLKHPSTRNYFYIYLQSRFKDNPITIYNTGIFSKLLLECFKSGLSTQNTFEVLGKLNELPFVMLYANSCVRNLSEGTSFFDSIEAIESDSSFKEFIQLGLFSNRIVEQLKNYCSYNAFLFESKLKRVVSYYYAFVYIQFLIVSVLLYQVIQIPMTAIGSQI
jgi:type II secretory pathway component PulF